MKVELQRNIDIDDLKYGDLITDESFGEYLIVCDPDEDCIYPVLLVSPDTCKVERRYQDFQYLLGDVNIVRHVPGKTLLLTETRPR